MNRWSSLSAQSRATFWRSLQTLNTTRVVIALVLLAYLLLGRDLDTDGAPYFLICLVYLLLALGFAALTLTVRRRFLLQVTTQVALDVAAISLLIIVSGGARSGLVIMYLFPLAGAAILTPLLQTLFWAALVTLFLLGDSVYQSLAGRDGMPLIQAGLYCGAFFALVTVLNRMAASLIGQEELAARRGADLAIQLAINQLIIADVGDGILVVGHDGQVFTGNPAAQYMLGLTDEALDFRLREVAALEPIAQAYHAWLEQDAASGVQRAAFVTVKPYQDAGPDGGRGAPLAAWSGRRELAAHLKLRFAKVDTAESPAGRCVIFMQDVTAIENRAQELKLASMGRLTASIAHEVRNPLSAIGHATSLLAEDLSGPAEQRLLKIVSDNVARVNRMVEDILQLSRKVQPGGDPLFLGPFLSELKSEFQETHALPDDMITVGNITDGVESVPVRFDALHLREVLVNLLTNAIRYASGKAGSIQLRVAEDGAGRMELHVQDDGPGITPEVRAHLFEPFYTTSSKGTGLGLYLARELCLNNKAKLDYEYRFDSGIFVTARASGRFVITFAQATAAG
jgi:two-component system sensor histidine kinase PilS (NtrC family)